MAASRRKPPLLGVLAAFAAVYFIWGSTYLGIRFAIETIPPFLMASLRFLSAGAILFAWTALRGEPWPGWARWRAALIVGTLLLVSGNGLLSWAELYVPSGAAALIVGTVPLWMVAMEAVRPGGSRPGAWTWLGLVLGFLGILILIGPDSLGGARLHLGGALAVVVAAFSWALGSVYSHSSPSPGSTLQNVGLQMLVGGAVLAVVALARGEGLELAAVSARSALALGYLSLVGGIVSYSAYVWLLEVSTPARVSTYAFVNPVVAVLLGWLLGGEILDGRVLSSSLAVVAAVAIITWSQARAGKRDDPGRGSAVAAPGGGEDGYRPLTTSSSSSGSARRVYTALAKANRTTPSRSTTKLPGIGSSHASLPWSAARSTPKASNILRMSPATG